MIKSLKHFADILIGDELLSRQFTIDGISDDYIITLTDDALEIESEWGWGMEISPSDVQEAVIDGERIHISATDSDGNEHEFIFRIYTLVDEQQLATIINSSSH